MTSMPEAQMPTAADSVAPDANAWETLQSQNQQLREQVAKLEHQLKQLQRMIFG
jgi:phage shock protein A